MDREKIFQFLAQILRNYVDEKQVSQKDLALQIGCSQSRLNDFLNKKGELGSAKFDLILRLFPELQRPILDALASRGGTAIHQEANGNTNSRITQTATVPPSGGAATSEARLRQQVTDLAVRLSDDNGTLRLAAFLKALQALG